MNPKVAESSLLKSSDLRGQGTSEVSGVRMDIL